MSTTQSQNAKVLQLLRTAPNVDFPLRQIMRFARSANVHSRASDLRKDGHIVKNTIVYHGRTKHSFYRLVKV